MSTLSSSLNALASSSVQDIFPERLERASDSTRLSVSRGLTLFWTVVFVVFALMFEDMNNPVVELGLSVASFTYGALLGAFALGVLTSGVREGDAIPAFVITVVAMVVIIFGVWVDASGGFVFEFAPSDGRIADAGLKSVAWPWYTFIGTVISLASGSLISIRHRYGHVSTR
jgi:Na+/proline symporter